MQTLLSHTMSLYELNQKLDLDLNDIGVVFYSLDMDSAENDCYR